MKIIFRGDDLGISKSVNLGIEKVVKEGVVKAVGLMVNMDNATHGINLIKDQTDLSLGLHVNICLGKSICDIEMIPTLIDPETKLFYKSKIINARKEDAIAYSDALIEVDAQFRKFIELTGKTPSYLDVHGVMSVNLFQAIEFIANKYGVPNLPIDFDKVNQSGIFIRPFGYYNPNYEPLSYVISEDVFYDKHNDDCIMMIFHPGYIDDELISNSNMVNVRPKEVEMLISAELKEWIKTMGYEVCSIESK